MNQSVKETWFVAEPIPQNTPFMMSVATQFMVQEWPKRGLGSHVKKYFTLFEKDTGKMCYVRPEFVAEAEFLSGKMLQNPTQALKTIAQIEQWSRSFFKEAKKFRKLPFAKLTNKQMLAAWQKPFKWHRLSHGVGASIAWHADEQGERVSKGISIQLENQIRTFNLSLDLAAVFSTLSTPNKQSAVKREGKDLLKLALSKGGYSALRAHAKKYEWLHYQYQGPALSLTYFADRIRAITLAKTNSKVLLELIRKKDNAVKKEKVILFKQLRLSAYQKQLIVMAQGLVYIKDFRKEALYHGMYCYEPFFREIGKRFGLSLDQVHALSYWEIIATLKKSRLAVSVDELNGRLTFGIAFITPKVYQWYVGKEAKDFLKTVTFEKVKKPTSNTFFGTCAYPGIVRGRVKIINIPQELAKMEKGDILVAHNTNPNLVPAMKKAAALLSGAGGLTCHTAIVARELQIPSVVGIPGIDTYLKDGDRIEVDATKGAVTILSSN